MEGAEEEGWGGEGERKGKGDGRGEEVKGGKVTGKKCEAYRLSM